MKQTIQKLLIGASVVVGASAIAITPASAITLSAAQVIGTDFEVWDNIGGVPGTNCSATAAICLGSRGTDTSNIIDILAGTAPSPGGNIELFKSSETLALPNFLAYDQVTSLKTNFSDGTNVTFSSLTAQDLFGSTLNTSYSATTVATTWFNAAFDANLPSVLTALGLPNEAALFDVLSLFGYNSRASLYNAFLSAGGFQRTVDPNIAFVNKEGNSVKFGLAGHSDLLFYAPPALRAFLARSGLNLRASELVKVSYDGKEEILYSFVGSPSNVASNDKSFNFTYVGDPVIVDPPVIDPPTESVPEPSAVLGLVAVGGLFAATRKFKKA